MIKQEFNKPTLSCHVCCDGLSHAVEEKAQPAVSSKGGKQALMKCLQQTGRKEEKEDSNLKEFFLRTQFPHSPTLPSKWNYRQHSFPQANYRLLSNLSLLPSCLLLCFGLLHILLVFIDWFIFSHDSIPPWGSTKFHFILAFLEFY